MITYAQLKSAPHHFESLTGLSIGQFDTLLEKLEPIWQQMNYTRLDRPNRQRCVGGGPDYKLELADRVLMTVMLLHLSLNMDALGQCFNVDKSTVSRNTRTILPALHALQNGTYQWGNPPKRGQGKCVEQILQDYPDLHEIFIGF